MEADISVQELLTAGNSLQSLIKSVEDAPFEILTLCNETANLNLIFTLLKRQDLGQDQKILISGILRTNLKQISSLKDLAEEMYKVYNGGDFRSKRRKWIRHRGSVSSSLQEMRYLRISIAASISTVFLSVIQSSELKLDRIISPEFDCIDSNVPNPISAKVETTKRLQWNHDQQPQLVLTDLTSTAKQDAAYLGLVFSIRQTTLCHFQCRCRCHTWEDGSPPPFLNNLMGALLAAHCKSPLRYTKCSLLQTCRRTSATTDQVTYFFPPKIIPKMIDIVQTMSHRGNPSVGLMTRRVAAPDEEAMVFTMRGDVKGLQYLISERKIDLRWIVSASGATPLSMALSSNDVGMSGFLIQQGLDPYLADADGITPNDIAWTKILGKVLSPSSTSTLSTMFASSFDPSAMGFTTLHKIVLGLSFRPLLTELENESTPIDAQDNVGTTCLNWAALRGDMDTIKLLLRYGADPNIACHDGLSPLHNAVTYLGSIEPTLALLEAGANIYAQSERGYQVLHFAVGFRAPVEYIEHLLNQGLDINHRSKDGNTALNISVRHNAPVVRCLLENGADPEIGSYQDEAATPLVRAVRLNRHEALSVLLDWGLGYEGVSGKGETVLHVAAEWGDEETLQILGEGVLEGVDVDGRNKLGLTARMVFEKRGVVEEELKVAFERLLESVRGGVKEGLIDAEDYDVE